jgi:hypothetical protein
VHSSGQQSIQLNGKRKNFCSYCNISGHWEKKCWKLHLEIHHKSSRQLVKNPLKKEAPSTIEKTRLQKESAWCQLGSKNWWKLVYWGSTAPYPDRSLIMALKTIV